MSRRASFFVEIRFTAERRWRAHSRRTDLLSAVKTAETLAHTRAEEWPYRVFPERAGPVSRHHARPLEGWTVLPMNSFPLLDAAERPPLRDTSLEAFDAILPTLTDREFEVPRPLPLRGRDGQP